MTDFLGELDLILAQTAANGITLTGGGAAVMGLSVVLVLGLNAFCIYRITHEQRPSEHLHAPLDIDTRDAD